MSSTEVPRLPPLYGGLDEGPRPAAREAGHAAHARGVGPGVVVEHVARALEQMEGAVAGALPEGPRPACARGCSSCCHQRVEVTVAEVVILARHLRSLDAPRRDELRARVAETASALEGLSGREHHLRQIPCALLDADGTCAAYAARPLACRRAHSTDASACAAAAREPASPAIIPHAPALAAHLSAIVIGYLEGASHAGLSPHQHELHAALRIALPLEEAPAHDLIERLAPARTRHADEPSRVLSGPIV